MITDYGTLKTAVTRLLHRSDLATDLPTFIDDARVRINRRFGLQLVAFSGDTDTNAVLTDHPDLYFLASVQAAYEFLNDGANATYFSTRWAEECMSQNINALSSATDPYNANPPVIVVT